MVGNRFQSLSILGDSSSMEAGEGQRGEDEQKDGQGDVWNQQLEHFIAGEPHAGERRIRGGGLVLRVFRRSRRDVVLRHPVGQSSMSA